MAPHHNNIIALLYYTAIFPVLLTLVKLHTISRWHVKDSTIYICILQYSIPFGCWMDIYHQLIIDTYYTIRLPNGYLSLIHTIPFGCQMDIYHWYILYHFGCRMHIYHWYILYHLVAECISIIDTYYTILLPNGYLSLIHTIPFGCRMHIYHWYILNHLVAECISTIDTYYTIWLPNGYLSLIHTIPFGCWMHIYHWYILYHLVAECISIIDTYYTIYCNVLGDVKYATNQLQVVFMKSFVCFDFMV